MSSMAAQEPAHKVIERHLRQLLAGGAGRGEPLPGEVELAERFGVSRMTVRQAFNSLVADGLVVRYRSKGTFASVRVLEDVSTLTSEDFLSRWEAQGHQVSMRMRALGLRPAPENVAERFAVPPQSTLYYVERLRLVDGLALAWDVRWLPAAFGEQVTAHELETTSLFSLLVDKGFEVVDMSFEIHARPASAEESRVLGCARAGTVLRREIMCTAPGGAAIIVGSSAYPAERVTYRARLAFDQSSYQPIHL
jgi:GntR family transcriptional regulator